MDLRHKLFILPFFHYPLHLCIDLNCWGILIKFLITVVIEWDCFSLFVLGHDLYGVLLSLDVGIALILHLILTGDSILMQFPVRTSKDASEEEIQGTEKLQVSQTESNPHSTQPW